jgi:peptidyl-prolyl cis-trans isomerase D
MGMMIKLRESTAVVLWIVVFAFGGLWVLQDSGAFDNIGFGQRQNIAVVEGEAISYQEFNEAFEQRLRAYRQQTGEEPSPAVRDQIADQVFQEMVDDVLREREMDRLGITVSDTEIRNMVFGPNPDPLIVQLFPDEQGGVDHARVISLFNDPETFQAIYGIDPIVLENYLRAKRRAEKLDGLLSSSVRVTDAEVAAEYVRRNKRATAEYVALRYAAIPDDEVQVTDRDLRRFYNENREDFRQPRTVALDYIAVSQTPSPADTQAVVNRLAQLRDEFAAAENDSVYVTQRFTDIPYSSEYRSPGQLEPELAAAVHENLSEGRVVGPVVAGGRGMLAKITSIRPAEESAVRARHILIGQQGEDEQVREQSRTRAEEILQRIRAGELSFSHAAREYSQDPGSAQRGGDLGYFTPGRMVAPFEQAAFAASSGEIVGPVETQFGYHIIQVLGRADHDVQLAILAQDVVLGSVTIRQLRDRVDDIKYYSEESGNLRAEAERHGLEVQTVTVQADQDVIPGIGANRQVRAFVENARQGRSSDVIDTGQHFVYLRATEVQREGYRPFDDVREELEPRVRLEKKREMQVANLREAFQQVGFEGLAEAVDSPVRTARNVQFTNTLIPALGREPRFVGTALGLGQNQTSNVVAGESAAFVIRVTELVEADPAQMSAEQREQIRNSLITRKIRQLSEEWMTDLRDRAEIQDYRAMLL